MDEYISRNELLKAIYSNVAEADNERCAQLLEAIAYAPTVDVVPKSEVEKLNNELMIWKQDRFNLYQRLELYEMTRQKVAREIFEEIERFLYLQFRFCKEEIGNDDTEYIKGRLELNTQIQNFIAELKKKYTENKE